MSNFMKDLGIIHLIGIGGIGMSGLAIIMKNMGFRIQGSDQNRNKNTNCSMYFFSSNSKVICLIIESSDSHFTS